MNFRKCVPLCVALCLILCTVLWACSFLISNAIILWDEGTYLLQTFSLSQSINTNQWQDVATQLFANSVYPPLHPLLLSLVTHPFAFSIPFIRTVNLLFFVGSALLIFLTASLLIGKKKTVFLPLVFVGLFITSPLVIYYSSVVMKELPGAFFTILTIFFYGMARKKQTFIFFLLSALSLTLLFLTKYNYGIVCLSGLLIEYGLLFVMPGTKKLRIFMTISILDPRFQTVC